MVFTSLVTFRLMSGILSNLFPFKASLNHGNTRKSGGLKSSEYGGCSICKNPFFARNCLILAMCERELLRKFGPDSEWDIQYYVALHNCYDIGDI